MSALIASFLPLQACAAGCLHARHSKTGTQAADFTGSVPCLQCQAQCGEHLLSLHLGFTTGLMLITSKQNHRPSAHRTLPALTGSDLFLSSNQNLTVRSVKKVDPGSCGQKKAVCGREERSRRDLSSAVAGAAHCPDKHCQCSCVPHSHLPSQHSSMGSTTAAWEPAASPGGF